MKIYFATTVLGDRSNLGHAKEIASILEKKGHEVLTKQFFRDDAYEADGHITPRDVFLRDIAWLREAEAVLIDATGSSFGTGFEAGFALSLSKPLFIFYNKSRAEKISRVARGMTHPNATVFAYSRVEELREFVEKTSEAHAGSHLPANPRLRTESTAFWRLRSNPSFGLVVGY